MKTKSVSKKSGTKGRQKSVIKNGLKFIRENGVLVLQGIIENTIDAGFHSYSRKQALSR